MLFQSGFREDTGLSPSSCCAQMWTSTWTDTSALRFILVKVGLQIIELRRGGIMFKSKVFKLTEIKSCLCLPVHQSEGSFIQSSGGTIFLLNRYIQSSGLNIYMGGPSSLSFSTSVADTK